jgi:hypothetical protein
MKNVFLVEILRPDSDKMKEVSERLLTVGCDVRYVMNTIGAMIVETYLSAASVEVIPGVSAVTKWTLNGAPAN